MRSKPTSRDSVLLVSLLGGVLGVLALFWVAGSGQVHRTLADAPSAYAGAPLGLTASGLTPDLLAPQQIGVFPDLLTQTSITCTLEVTTTDHAPFGNHSLSTAAPIANYTDQTLVPNGDPGAVLLARPDFYRLDNATVGYRYTVQAKPDWTTNYNLGMIVYDRNQRPIITDTNTFDNNYASITLVADNNGPYYFEVFQISDQCTGHTYSLILSSTAPTATPTATSTPSPTPTTPTPVPTYMGGFDAYEPNFDFSLATTIAPGVFYEMNFIPWGGAQVDNDFLKIRIKPGLQVTCETSDLDPGVDPRMVMYSGPGDQYFLMANDDIELGDFNSRLSYFATYEGYLYILVGQGDRMALRDTTNSSYTISCEMSVPGMATPVPGYTPAEKGGATPTPRPAVTATPAPTATPRTSVIATPTPGTAAQVDLAIRLISTPAPRTPAPEAGGLRTFRVVIYFDGNQDGQIGAGEGVAGFYVVVVSPDGSQELAQGYTDEQGQVAFTVPTVGTVRVLVPLLGIDRLVEASKPEIRIRIIPPSLPQAIP